jgi:hypothetical protein
LLKALLLYGELLAPHVAAVAGIATRTKMADHNRMIVELSAVRLIERTA